VGGGEEEEEEEKKKKKKKKKKKTKNKKPFRIRRERVCGYVDFIKLTQDNVFPNMHNYLLHKIRSWYIIIEFLTEVW
jgi:hypothetical protein